MYEWVCPYCGGKEYSASDHKEQKNQRCAYCGRRYPNPYYKGDSETGEGK